jgi:RING finger protein 113A
MEGETAAQPDVPVVVFRKRGTKANARKRPATPPPESSSEEDYSSQDEGVRQVKRRRKIAVVTASSATQKAPNQDFSTTKFEADRSATIAETNDATRQSNWYEDDLSTQNLLGKTRKTPSTAVVPTEVDPNAALDGKYKGTAAYSSFISKNKDAPPKLVGPMKAPTNIRTITITDFAPDVCKDYKQTGFCGFGDNCKFLHAREDYKQGWALDRDWEIKTKGKKQAGTIVASANKALLEDDDEEEADAALLEKIPFACTICKKPYTDPILTKCGHYFCESCALQRYRKKPDCAACGAGTNGAFNGAKGLNKLLERKRIREQRLKEKAEAEKEDE